MGDQVDSNDWFYDPIQERKDRDKAKKEEKIADSLLTPEEYDTKYPTVYTKYGVALDEDDTVDLTRTLEQVFEALEKGKADTGRYTGDAIKSFARDLLALQESHKTYMDNLAEQTLKAPEINWAERTGILSQKARADYVAGEENKVGRMETIITSPLMDDTDPVTTKNILGGS